MDPKPRPCPPQLRGCGLGEAASGPPLRTPGQTTGGSAGLGREEPLKHSFSFGQAPRQPPGDCRPYRPAFASRPAAGPRGGSRYRSGYGLSRRDSGEPGRCREPEEGTLKICFSRREPGLSARPETLGRSSLDFFQEKKKTKRTQTPRASALPREGSQVPRPSR